MPHARISATDIETYQRDETNLIRELFRDQIEPLRAGIGRNISGFAALLWAWNEIQRQAAR